MKLTQSALALILAASAVPAAAQYGSMGPPAKPPAMPAPTTTAEPPADNSYKPNISNQARKEIIALQAAVNGKDSANVPALLAAAKAKAKTKDDHYVIAQLQLKAAVDADWVSHIIDLATGGIVGHEALAGAGHPALRSPSAAARSCLASKMPAQGSPPASSRSGTVRRVKSVG